MFQRPNTVRRVYVLFASLAAAMLGAAFCPRAEAAPGGLNSAPITIASQANATPYPSTINVTDVGTVSGMNVTLRGVTHGDLSHLTVLLVSPAGTAVQLMANAPGSASNIDLRFSENGQLFVGDPVNETQVFRPTVIPAPVPMPAPAPAPPYQTSFLAFAGESFTGVWSLYVRDNTPGISGTIAEGWAIGFGGGGGVPFSTEFTYQGVVTENGQPVTGVRDIRLSYFDVPTNDFGPVGAVGSSTTTGVQVTGGRFTASFTPPLSVFNFAEQTYVEVAVSLPGTGVFTTLSPRQKMTAAPFATLARRAVTADFADNVTSIQWGQIIGIPPEVLNPFTPWQTVGGTNLTNINTGNVLVGTGSGTSKLTVNGTIESLSGGIKFPDDTVQSTAAGMRLITSGTTAVNLGAIASGSTALHTVNLAVSTLSSDDSVLVSPSADMNNGLFIAYARVISANQIRIAVGNNATTAIDPPSITFNFRVIR